MKIGIAIIAATVAFGATAASAQPGWYGHGYGYGGGYGYGDGNPYGGRPYYAAMPRHRVLSVVRGLGLRPVSEAMRVGRSFVVDAVDSSGRLKRVTIDAYYGQVVRIAAVSRPDYPPRRDATFSRPGVMSDEADAPEEYGAPPRRAMRAPAPAEARLPDEDERDASPPMPLPRAGSMRPGGMDTPVGREIPPPPAPLNTHKAAKPVPPKHEKNAARGKEERAAPTASKPRSEGDRSAAVNPHPTIKPPARHAPLDVKPADAKSTETPAAAKPAAKPATQAAAPRIVLPGGPSTKSAPAAAPEQPAHTPPADKPAATPAPGSSELPPVQSLD